MKALNPRALGCLFVAPFRPATPISSNCKWVKRLAALPPLPSVPERTGRPKRRLNAQKIYFNPTWIWRGGRLP